MTLDATDFLMNVVVKRVQGEAMGNHVDHYCTSAEVP